MKEKIEMLNTLRDKAHKNAVQKGFWKEVNIQRALALVISEVGEAVEADRQGKTPCVDGYYQLKNSTKDPVAITEGFLMYMKDTTGDELADVFIRLLDYCGYREIDIEAALRKQTQKDRSHNCKFFLLNYLNLCICRIAYTEETSGKTAGLPAMVAEAFDVLNDVALKMGVSLLVHIQEKMNYNAGREHLHGKRY